jgi:hypothetical protein
MPETTGILFYDTTYTFSEYSLMKYFSQKDLRIPHPRFYNADNRFTTDFIDNAKKLIEEYNVSYI